jgi:hypothetical protein
MSGNAVENFESNPTATLLRAENAARLASEESWIWPKSVHQQNSLGEVTPASSHV